MITVIIIGGVVFCVVAIAIIVRVVILFEREGKTRTGIGGAGRLFPYLGIVLFLAIVAYIQVKYWTN